MTPWGLRKKLRGMLGGGGASTIVRHPVTFVLPGGAEVRLEVEEHYSLLMASQGLDAPISTGRRAGGTCPDGGCGLCRVEVLDASGLSPMKPAERASLDAMVRGDVHEGRERPPGAPLLSGTRLACHTKVVGPGARVQVLALFDYESLKGDPTGS
jgi:ferredoxin